MRDEADGLIPLFLHPSSFIFILMRSPPPDPAATAVRRRPSLDFSLTGLVYCSMMMFMGLAAINIQNNLLFGVFGLMIGILLVSGIISRLVLRRLEVRRILPEHAAVGRAARVEYVVTNAKHFWPSLSVTVAELDGNEAFTKQPHAYLLHAAARSSAVVQTKVTPKRRGLHAMGRYQLVTSFPFGFIKRAVIRRAEDSILVYPPTGDVDRRLIRRFRPSRSRGAETRPRAGGGDEFYGVREYRAGDSPRRIYWRRSAARGLHASGGTLVAKEFTQIAPPKVLVLVDTFSPPGAPAGHAAEVERAVAMAASVAAACVAGSLPVGLLGRGEHGWEHVAANRGKRHGRELMTLLARLPINRNFDVTALRAAAAAQRDSETTVVLCTPAGGVQSGDSRGADIALSTQDPAARAYFKFDPALDFATVGPVATAAPAK